MKYPKKWIDCLMKRPNGLAFHQDCEDILERLNEVGALKGPPKPREWWIHKCEFGVKLTFRLVRPDMCDNPNEWIHVREVEEE